ncbi:DUF3298 domain-containing protein [Pasteurellaceae bacterium 15-036681]|nr:DUF3298 domain-containing protein [Pasteurellaceae bacterium 15-036681]
MKKSFIALLLSSIFLLSACDDSQLTQKIVEAEKQITQLGNELKRNQADLSAKAAELDALKAQYEEARSELDKAKSRTFPALQVEIVKLIDKSETLKFPKDPKDEYAREESTVSVFASASKTQVEWLDSLLLNEIYKSSLSEDELKAYKGDVTFEKAQVLFNAQFDNLVSEAKADKPIGLSESIESRYLGQRNNIVSFTQLHSTYTGGAHGMYYTRYLNVDINKQALITLDTLIAPKNQAKLKELLWESYASERIGTDGKMEQPYAEKADFRISDEFYFTPYGITFVYPPYELGSFAEGEIEVPVSFYQLNELVNPEYRLTEKDGFGLNPNEF